MKSILFEVDFKSIQNLENPNSVTNPDFPYIVSIDLPLLPAFSIEYMSLNVNGVSDLTSPQGKIDNTKLNILSQFKIEESFEVTVVLYHHGIRDYSLLFYWIPDLDLRNRIGYYHEEADKNFESASWLSFAIMCGAIFEGVLTAKHVNGKDFYEKIEKAYVENLIDYKQKEIFHKVRKFRNSVHANRYNDPLINRKDAMDIKNTLNMIIKSFSKHS